jgi:hypothetical protein
MQPLKLDVTQFTTAKPCPVFELLKKHKKCRQIWLSTFTLSESVITELNKLSSKYEIIVLAAKLPNGIGLQDCKFRCQLTPWNHAKVWGFGNVVYAGSTNLCDDTILNLMFKLSKGQSLKVYEWFKTIVSFQKHQAKTTII